MSRMRRMAWMVQWKSWEKERRAQTVAQSRHHLQQNQRKQADLMDYQHAYQAGLWADPAQSGISSRDLIYKTRFLGQLNTVVALQSQQVQALEIQVKQGERAWQESHRQVQIFEKIYQQYQEQVQQIEAKQAQKTEDERAQSAQVRAGRSDG